MPSVRSPSQPWVADLHIHSRYSRACSRDLDLPNLAWWGQRKGVTLLGTGDVTHPGWFEHLRETLVPAEPGLYRLHPDREAEVARRLPVRLQAAVRFLLSVEISTIYKRDDRTRKVHHLVYLPDLDAPTRSRYLSAIRDDIDLRTANIGMPDRGAITLPSRDGVIPLTLVNNTGSPVSVVIQPASTAMKPDGAIATANRCSSRESYSLP